MTIFSINSQLYTHLTEKASTLGTLNTGKMTHWIRVSRDRFEDIILWGCNTMKSITTSIHSWLLGSQVICRIKSIHLLTSRAKTRKPGFKWVFLIHRITITNSSDPALWGMGNWWQWTQERLAVHAEVRVGTEAQVGSYPEKDDASEDWQYPTLWIIEKGVKDEWFSSPKHHLVNSDDRL